MDPELRQRLAEVGVDPDSIADPSRAWTRLRTRFGARVTILERYEIEAATLGLDVDDLSPATKTRLGREVLDAQFPGIELLGQSSGGPVEIVPYEASWPHRFQEWRTRLAAVLGTAALTIDHVGSTAVPGLAAKPIVDIQVGVADLEDEASYVTAIESTGVPLRSRDAVHRYFRPRPGQPRLVQVHVCRAYGPWARDHVLFRDYLRQMPTARDNYASLKIRLAKEYRDDRLAYTDAAANFILDTLVAARTWAAATGWTMPTST
jgi:GrpB-like predicted nucleotidyltransferase (UPF0157 family)